MPWNFDNEKPIYTQLLERIQMQIVSGTYQPGCKLPSVRELAAEAAVNPNTMQKAFAELERSGLILTQRTSGRTVTEDIALIKEVQNELAKKYIQVFFMNMKELGYSKQEIVVFLNDTAKEVD